MRLQPVLVDSVACALGSVDARRLRNILNETISLSEDWTRLSEDYAEHLLAAFYLICMALGDGGTLKEAAAVLAISCLSEEYCVDVALYSLESSEQRRVDFRRRIVALYKDNALSRRFFEIATNADGCVDDAVEMLFRRLPPQKRARIGD